MGLQDSSSLYPDSSTSSEIQLHHRNLLAKLISTVETALAAKAAQVWQVYGAFDRILNIIEPIIYDGCKITNEFNVIDPWDFFVGLRVLKPDLWPCLEIPSGTPKTNVERIARNLKWINCSLRNHQLLHRLSVLVKNKDHLEKCYYPNAFLRSNAHTTAAFVCLSALEQNSEGILAQIEPHLFTETYKEVSKETPKVSMSLPSGFGFTTSISDQNKISVKPNTLDLNKSDQSLEKSSEIATKLDDSFKNHSFADLKLSISESTNNQIDKPTVSSTKVSISTSELLTAISNNSQTAKNEDQNSKEGTTSKLRTRKYSVDKLDSPGSSKSSLSTTSQQTQTDKQVTTGGIPKRLFRRTHSRSRSDGAQPSADRDPKLGASASSCTDGAVTRKRFMEDGGQSITIAADGYIPSPLPGQSLVEFLSSSDFNKSNAELDRENLHFHIAEACLSALEKWNMDSLEKKILNSSSLPEDSDEDVQTSIQHKRRVRPRKFIRHKIFPTPQHGSESTTDYSMYESPRSSTHNSSEEFSDLDEREEDLISKDETQSPSNETGILEDSLKTESTTAENVALSLLQHFNDKKMPKAEDIAWLVSEQDVNQKLLPMPNSVAISPDDIEPKSKDFASKQNTTLLRGTEDWAPPRPQLILTMHRVTKRTTILEGQKWRCAGCGLLVTAKLSRHFRLCHYLGRYFCTACHDNKTSIIPANIIQKWDFTKYYVSNFSYELLCRMSADPLLNIGALNPQLYHKSHQLYQAHVYRMQLYHAKSFIYACSRTQMEKKLLESIPNHWITEPGIFSIDDLIAVKNYRFVPVAKRVTQTCIEHIAECEVCNGRGFICEICKKGNPIYPFQLDAVVQCKTCMSCFHVLCFKPETPCPKCERKLKHTNT